MRKIFMFAVAAAMFAACSSDDSLAVDQTKTQQLEQGAVGFDAYTGKVATRAGYAGTLTTDQLKKTATPGFGVFAYYTDNNDYDQRSIPDFFYNQKVTWSTSASPNAWVYEPVKYWPNEHGSNAISEESDKVSFFAYAPWVDVVPTSGKLAGAAATPALETWGITGMTKNNATGDPMLKYIASFREDRAVDLCWGVADNNDGKWEKVNDGLTQNIANGTPWLNVERPAQTNQRIRFTFKHALAQMRMNIDAVVNDAAHSLSNEVDKNTRIWVRQITFKGFALKGTLNLNNDAAVNTPNWLDYNGQNELVAEDVIVYDGRKDGKEGVAGAIATNEKLTGLNPDIVQDGVYAPAEGDDVYDPTKALLVQSEATPAGTVGDALNPYKRTGVNNIKKSLFDQTGDAKNASGTDKIFYVIPMAEDFEVEIIYDVETVSENLAQNLSDGATKGTSVENRIRKMVKFGDDTRLAPGHSYKLDLHLGMNTVDLDASVTDWVEETAQEVDLPLNTPVLATAAPTDPNVTAGLVAYNAETYDFAIAGFNGSDALTAIESCDGGESITANLGTDQGKSNSATGTTATTNLTSWDKTNAEKNAWANGYAVEQLTTAVNPTTSNRTQKVTWTGGQSSKVASITFTQAAHPLELYVTASSGTTHNTVTVGTGDETKKIQLSRSSEITSGFGWMSAGLAKNCAVVTPTTLTEDNPNDCGIQVKRNGVALTWATTTTNADTFTFGDTDGIITLKDDKVVGDVYEITLKTGDAPAETISVKVIP